MEISVADAAASLGVSPRRVQVLLAGGRLPGRRVGRDWLVDERGLVRVPRRSRPLSGPMAEAVLRVLSGGRPDLDARSRRRLRDLLTGLLAGDDPAARLTSWVPVDRRQVRSFSVADRDLLDLRADPRVVPTGPSDLRSGLMTSGELEARVWVRDLDAVVRDFLLVETGRPNVRLLPGEPVGPGQLPLGRFLVDLSAHPGPRESATVRGLLYDIPDLLRDL